MTDQMNDFVRLCINLDHRHKTVPSFEGVAIERDLIGQLTVVQAEYRLRSCK